MGPISRCVDHGGGALNRLEEFSPFISSHVLLTWSFLILKAPIIAACYGMLQSPDHKPKQLSTLKCSMKTMTANEHSSSSHVDHLVHMIVMACQV